MNFFLRVLGFISSTFIGLFWIILSFGILGMSFGGVLHPGQIIEMILGAGVALVVFLAGLSCIVCGLGVLSGPEKAIET